MQYAILPNIDIPKGVPLRLTIEWWFWTIASDVDNPTKPFIDSLQDKYWIDDKRIFKLDQEKAVVWAWSEYISFKIEEYPQAKTKKNLQRKNKKI